MSEIEPPLVTEVLGMLREALDTQETNRKRAVIAWGVQLMRAWNASATLLRPSFGLNANEALEAAAAIRNTLNITPHSDLHREPPTEHDASEQWLLKQLVGLLMAAERNWERLPLFNERDTYCKIGEQYLKASR